MSLIDDTTPARDIVPVTPSDTVDLPDGDCRGILVGVAGIVRITTVTGQDRTITLLMAGVVHPIRARRIWASTTTATGISAAY